MTSPKTFLTFFFIGLILFIGSYRINFVQNDEYIHYQTLNSFMSGKYTLMPYLGSTYFTQGLLALAFSFIFTVKYIPLLTAFLSFGSLVIFYLILNKKLKIETNLALMCILLLFVNPLYIYSSFGFMSEIYLVFLLLLGSYFVYSFELSDHIWDFILADIFFVLAFFVKQFGIVALVALIPYFVIKNRIKFAVIQSFILGLLWFLYTFYFPQSEHMKLTSVILKNLTHFDHSYAVLLVIGIYLCLFSFPLVFATIKNIFAGKNIKTLGLLALFCVTIYVAVFHFFRPDAVRHVSTLENGSARLKTGYSTFPYLPNIFTPKGFLSENLVGTKYEFAMGDVLFKYMAIIGKITLVIFASAFIFSNKKHITYEIIFITLFLCLLVITPNVYDRYLLAILPFFMILLARNISQINVFILGAFIFAIIFFGFLSYQFEQDFYFVNNYIWNKSLVLNKTNGVALNMIRSENSWYHTYDNPSGRWNYYFEYKGTEKQLPTDANFEVIEKHSIDFVGNKFNDPKVFLVERKTIQ